QAVKGIAADACARMQRVPALLLEQDAERQGEWMQPFADERVVELLDARFVADRRIGIGFARRWVGRVDAMLAVHAVEVLGLRIIRLEIVVPDRPGRRDPAVVPDLAEVLLAQAEQRRTVHLRAPADVVM